MDNKGPAAIAAFSTFALICVLLIWLGTWTPVKYGHWIDGYNCYQLLEKVNKKERLDEEQLRLYVYHNCETVKYVVK